MCRFRHIRRCPHRSATFNLSDDGFMTISIKRSSIYRVRCSLPFLERLFSDERILDDAAKSEWIDEVQARLCAAVDTLCANISETSRPSTITVGRGKKSHFDKHEQDKYFFRCVAAPPAAGSRF